MMLATGALSVGCARTPTGGGAAARALGLVQELAGCYRFTHETPTTLTRSTGAGASYELRLDTIRRFPGAREDYRVAITLDQDAHWPRGVRGQRRAGLWWLATGPDSVQVSVRATGTESVMFYGRATGPTLRGMVRLTTDAIPVDGKTGRVLWEEYPSAVASAERIPCP